MGGPLGFLSPHIRRRCWATAGISGHGRWISQGWSPRLRDVSPASLFSQATKSRVTQKDKACHLNQQWARRSVSQFRAPGPTVPSLSTADVTVNGHRRLAIPITDDQGAAEPARRSEEKRDGGGRRRGGRKIYLYRMMIVRRRALGEICLRYQDSGRG